MPTYDLETVDALPASKRSWPPPLEERKAVWVGATVRLLVIINGRTPEFPWVYVTKVDDGKYTGRCVEDYGGHIEGDVIPKGHVFEFGPEHIIAI